MELIINWLLATLAVLLTSYLLPGINLNGLTTAVLVALVLGVINAVIRPILFILTLPINILTLGLFTLVINAVLVMLTAAIIPGFEVNNFWWAMLFSIILAVVNWGIHHAFKK
jgi:putative membrane protein